VGVLEVVEQLAVADLLHLDGGQCVGLESLGPVVEGGVLVVREHGYQVVVEGAFVHFDFVDLHPFFAV